MNAIFAVLLCITAAPEDEYLGRLAYRAQTEKQYSWENYQKDKAAYLALPEIDRKALAYATQLKSSQSFSGATNSMRLEQTAPIQPLPNRAYLQPWNLPYWNTPYHTFYPYPHYLYQIPYPYHYNLQYHFLIR